MICNKCGTTNIDGVSFCSSCGEKLTVAQPAQKHCPSCGETNEVGSQFCSKCARPLESTNPTGMPVSSAFPMAAQVPPTGSGSQVPSAKGQKAKGKFFKTAVIVAVIIAVIGGGVVFAANIFKRDFNQLLQGEEKYSKNKIRDLAVSLTDIVIDSFDTYKELNSSDGKTAISGEFAFELTMKVDDNIVDELTELLEIDESYSGLVKLAVSSGLTASIKVNVTDPDIALSADIEWKVKNQKILSANIVLVDEVVFVSCAELYSQTIAFDLADYGVDLSSVFEQGFGSMYGANYTMMFDAVNNVADLIVENKNLIKTVRNELIDVVLAELDNFKISNNTSVMINDVSAKLDKTTVVIDEQMAVDAVLAGAKVILENEEFIDFCAELATEFEGNDIEASDISDSLENFIDDNEYYEAASDSDFEFSMYFNSNDSVAGLGMYFEETEMSYLFQNGVGYELSIEDGYEESTVRVYGNLSGGSSNMKGDLSVSVDSEYQDLDLKILSFEGLAFDKSNNYLPSAKITINIGEILNESGSLSFVPGADLIEDLVAIYDFKQSQKTSDMTLSLKSDINGYSIDANAGFKLGEAEIAEPKNVNDAVYILPYETPEIDFLELQENLTKLLENIENLDINVDFLNDALESMFIYGF